MKPIEIRIEGYTIIIKKDDEELEMKPAVKDNDPLVRPDVIWTGGESYVIGGR